jgi:iron complex outermembrane receptor protein/vitamin B12 transporter
MRFEFLDRLRAGALVRPRVFRTAAFVSFFLASLSAHAVVVRGRVLDPLGRPLMTARVQLVLGGQVVASTQSLPDGTYEIRSTEEGRFVLLSSAPGFAANIQMPFYSRALDIVNRDITMSVNSVQEQVSVTATGLPTPLEQTSASVTLIAPEQLATQTDLLQEMRLQPGVSVVQSGQNGAQTSLFVRGGNSTANKVLIDGVPGNDVGGVFDFGIVSTTGVSAMEVHRGPDSVLYGSDAGAGVVRFDTPRGISTRPVLNYSGDAGNFHTWRNEVELSGAHRKLDYYTAFSRYDSSNALPGDRFHVGTSAANLGYALNGSTSLRGTVRYAASAGGVPNAHDFFGISQNAKQSDQNVFFTGVLENNVVLYYGARKREQYVKYSPTGDLISAPFGDGYYGKAVTIRGANGYTGTGRAELDFPPFNPPGDSYPQARQSASLRDGVQYQTDYRFGTHLAALGTFRYEDERGMAHIPQSPTYPLQLVERRNYDYNLQFQGDVKERVFFSLGGGVQKNYLYGTEGVPRLGLAYFPIHPGTGWLHGTKLKFNFAKGVQEPDVVSQIQSLYNVLLRNGLGAQAVAAHVAPIGAQRSRTYEGGFEQNILGERLKLGLTYFHTQYGRQVEYVGALDLTTYFNLPFIPSSNGDYGAYINSLDYLASGVETSAEWRATRHLFVRGGYTYLNTRVERSFAFDVTSILSGFPQINPNYPGIAIGSTSPLVGQRVFRRPPQTGYIDAEYTATKWSAGVKAAFVSRADDSTFLGGMDENNDNTLLLPNRNLDFAYQRVDANVTYQVMSHVTVFTQMNNLLGQQKMGPIGYSALPFNFRSGLKIRLGGF